MALSGHIQVEHWMGYGEPEVDGVEGGLITGGEDEGWEDDELKEVTDMKLTRLRGRFGNGM